ncbi:transposase [Deinococcus metallilatus]|uniref:Transposase n=1 Tax=Deinococcus metallilatus TaxID=1211322 RepID=A0ABR6MN84_9DEIO|nr:transposase [Deinococcus metallilatus]GMA15373.1 transposase [Deinococcus metallilatus]
MQLARTSGNLSGTARDLGINVSLLRKWMNAEQEKGEAAFPGQGKQILTPEQQEIQRLRKENETLRQEREILKKAAAFLPRAGPKAVWGLGRFFAKATTR